MRTRDIMTSPVVTVAPDVILKDVAALLVERGINAVPVVDAGDRLCGIVSEADLLTLETPARGGQPHTAREVMSQSVYTLAEDTDAAAAARMMLRHGLRSVPVVAGERVVGIVARRDLLRLVARGDDEVRADLEARLRNEIALLQRLRVEVAGGVVTVAGAGDLGRQPVVGLARRVPGVVEVRSGDVQGAALTADGIRARRHARELVADMHWRGITGAAAVTPHGRRVPGPGERRRVRRLGRPPGRQRRHVPETPGRSAPPLAPPVAQPWGEEREASRHDLVDDNTSTSRPPSGAGTVWRPWGSRACCSRWPEWPS